VRMLQARMEGFQDELVHAVAADPRLPAGIAPDDFAIFLAGSGLSAPPEPTIPDGSPTSFRGLVEEFVGYDKPTGMQAWLLGLGHPVVTHAFRCVPKVHTYLGQYRALHPDSKCAALSTEVLADVCMFFAGLFLDGRPGDEIIDSTCDVFVQGSAELGDGARGMGALLSGYGVMMQRMAVAGIEALVPYHWAGPPGGSKTELLND
jgi:hypothetical protein